MSGLMESVFGGGSREEAPSEVRSYTAEALRDAARDLVKGKKCPHGRRVLFVSSHVEVRGPPLGGVEPARGSAVLVVEAGCPHDEDRRSFSYERVL